MAKYTDYVKHVQHFASDKIRFIDPNSLCCYRNEEGKPYTIDDAVDGVANKVRFPWNTEDLCIDMDLIMEVRPRGDYAYSSNEVYYLHYQNKGHNLSLMSGRRFYYGENRMSDNASLKANLAAGTELKTGKFVNYLSTSDYDATFQDVLHDYISTEMLGIESIDISYVNAFCPLVTLKLKDVRGLGLMSTTERNHTKEVDGVTGYARNDVVDSFYSALNALPYPRVSLRVKGIYGAPTVYDLTFSKKSDSFDPNLGCWTMTIEFIGYAYSFLTEVPIAQVLSSPSCQCAGGKSYWDNVILTDSRYKLGADNPMPWMNIMKSLSEAQDELKKQAENGEGIAGKIQNAQNAIGSLNVLKQMASNIALGKAYLYNTYVIPSIKEGDVQGELVHYQPSNGCCCVGYMNISEDVDNSFEKRQGKFSAVTDVTSFVAQDAEWIKAKLEFYEQIKKVQKECKAAEFDFNILCPDVDIICANEKVALSSNKTRFGGLDQNSINVLNSLDAYYQGNAKAGLLQKYSGSNEQALLNTVKSRYCVAVICLVNGQYSLLDAVCDTAINQLNEIIKVNSDKAKAEEIAKVAEHLGFTPTLRNVVKLIMMHCENYFNMIYTAADTIGTMSSSGQRDVAKAGLTKADSDFSCDHVPPFPSMMTKQNDTIAQDWIGKLPYDVFKPEIDLVNSLLNATADTVHTAGIGYADNGDAMANVNIPSTVFQGAIPLCMTDIMAGGNPFITLTQSDIDCFTNNGDLTPLLTALEYRARIITSQHCMQNAYDAFEGKRYGKYDGINLYYYLKESCKLDINDAFIQKLTDAYEQQHQWVEWIDKLSFSSHKNIDKNQPLIEPTYISRVGGDYLKSYDVVNVVSGSNVIKQSTLSFEKYHNDASNKWQTFCDPSIVATSDNIELTNMGDIVRKLDADGRTHGKINMLKNYVFIDADESVKRNIRKPSQNEDFKDFVPMNKDNYPLYSFLSKFDPKEGVDNILGVSTGDESKNAFIERSNRESVRSNDEFFVDDAMRVGGLSKLVPSLNLLHWDTSKRSFEVEDFSGDTNVVTNANLFLSTAYYGMNQDEQVRGVPLKTFYRANYFLFQDKLSENSSRFHIDGTTIVVDSPLFDSDKILSVLAKGNVSNGVLLQMGAACWAKFFNPHSQEAGADIVLWDTDLNYQNKYGHKNFWSVLYSDSYDDSRTRCKYRLNWFQGHEYVNDVSCRPYYEIMWYVLATYYEQWVLGSFMRIQNALEIQSLNTDCDTFVENMTKIHEAIRDEDEKQCAELFGSVASNYKLRFDLDSSTYFSVGYLLYGFAAEVSDAVFDMLNSYVKPVKMTAVFFPLIDDSEDVDSLKYVRYTYKHEDYIDDVIGIFLALTKKMKEIEEQRRKEAEKNGIQQTPEANALIDSKISVYYSLKRLWDKWLGGCQRSSAANGSRTNWLNIDYINNHFHFIDTFYNEIGDKVLLDMNLIMSIYNQAISQQQNWNLLTFLNSILGKSRIQLHCIQNFANLADPNAIAQAFVPMTYYEAHDLPSYKEGLGSEVHTHFVCIYTYEPSHTVGCATDSPKRDYTGDGFMLDDNLMTSEDHPTFCNGLGGQWAIPAFAVTYGSQYQSYFTNITAKIDSNNNTEYSMIASLQLAQMGSDKLAQQTKYVGQDLYTIQSNQSFTVDVDMVGCAWIQPLMYFVLTNIPMYRGTYIIQKVTHNITAGQMKTHFSGVKMSRFANKFVDSAYMTQFNDDLYNENHVTERNVVAALDNDCSYKVFTPKQEEAPSANWENTINIQALKEYRPFYVERAGYANLWDALCCMMELEAGIPKDSDSDRLKMMRKLSYLAMFNSHAEFATNSGYQKIYANNSLEDSKKKNGIYLGAWHELCCSAFAGSFGYGKTIPSNRELTEQYLTDVLSNPIQSVLGDAKTLDVTVGDYTFHRCTKNKKYVGEPQLAKNLPAYYNKEAKGVIGDVTSVDVNQLRKFNMYSIPYEYADEIHKGHHHNARYMFTYMADNDLGHIFLCGSFRQTDLWTEEWFSQAALHPTTDEGTQSNDSASANIVAFLEAVQKTMNVTHAFNGDKLLNYITNEEPKDSDFKNDYALITCKDSKHNALLFDLITRGNNEGYYGWCDVVSWCSDAESCEQPVYLMVHACKKDNNVRPKFYLRVLGSADSPSGEYVSEDYAKSLMETNTVVTDDKGEWLKSIPNTLWMAFKKNVKREDNVKNNPVLMSFSYMFGGTQYVEENWGPADKPTQNQFCYYINSTNVKDCETLFPKVNTRTPKECMKFNQTRTRKKFDGVKYEDIFEGFENPTLHCTTSNKLKDVRNGGKWHGPIDDAKQRITSGYGKRTVVTKNGIKHEGFHYGLDLAAFVPATKANLVAPYDGICTDVFYSDGGYGFLIVGLLNIQNENGEWLAFLSGHHDCPEDINIRGGQNFTAGEVLGKIGRRADGINYCTGVHSHFQTAWVSKTTCTDKDGNFKWSERYGPNNYLLSKSGTHIPFDLRKYVELIDWSKKKGQG